MIEIKCAINNHTMFELKLAIYDAACASVFPSIMLAIGYFSSGYPPIQTASNLLLLGSLAKPFACRLLAIKWAFKPLLFLGTVGFSACAAAAILLANGVPLGHDNAFNWISKQTNRFSALAAVGLIIIRSGSFLISAFRAIDEPAPRSR